LFPVIFVAYAGFILNLGKLENIPFYENSGKTWNNQGILYNVYSNQEKIKKNRLFDLYIIYGLGNLLSLI